MAPWHGQIEPCPLGLARRTTHNRARSPAIRENRAAPHCRGEDPQDPPNIPQTAPNSLAKTSKLSYQQLRTGARFFKVPSVVQLIFKCVCPEQFGVFDCDSNGFCAGVDRRQVTAFPEVLSHYELPQYSSCKQAQARSTSIDCEGCEAKPSLRQFKSARPDH